MTNNTDAATLRLRHAADEAICAWREIHAQAAFQLGSTDEFPRLAIAMTELQKAMGDEPTWRELFPEGRTIFYEGDDPETFAQEILADFPDGIDYLITGVGTGGGFGTSFTISFFTGAGFTG